MSEQEDLVTPDLVLVRLRSGPETDHEPWNEDPNLPYHLAGKAFGGLMFRFVDDRSTDLAFSPSVPSDVATRISELNNLYIEEARVARNPLEFAEALSTAYVTVTLAALSSQDPFAKTTYHYHKGIMSGFGLAAFTASDFPAGIKAMRYPLGRTMLDDNDTLEALRIGIGENRTLELAVAFQIASEFTPSE